RKRWPPTTPAAAAFVRQVSVKRFQAASRRDGVAACVVPSRTSHRPTTESAASAGGRTLEEAGEREAGPALGSRTVPLHEDRALVAPEHDRALGAGAREQEAHGALEAQEARGREGDAADEQPLERRLADAEDGHRLVEEVDEVVLGVVERAVRDRERVAQEVPGPGREAQGVAQDFHEVVLHEQRLELVDGEPRVALAPGERDVEAAPLDPFAADELGHGLEQPPARLAKVRRVNLAGGRGQREVERPHHLLREVGEDGRPALAAALRAHAVEVDEVHGLGAAVHVGRAVSQPRPDEREVRVAVLGLPAPLFLPELRAPLELVVVVVGAGREKLLEETDEGVEALAAVLEPGGEALFEGAAGRVVRAIERPGGLGEHVAVDLAHGPGHVDGVVARLRYEPEVQLQRRGGHQNRSRLGQSRPKGQPAGETGLPALGLERANRVPPASLAQGAVPNAPARTGNRPSRRRNRALTGEKRIRPRPWRGSRTIESVASARLASAASASQLFPSREAPTRGRAIQASSVSSNVTSATSLSSPRSTIGPSAVQSVAAGR